MPGQPDDRSTAEITDGLQELYVRAAAAIAIAVELCAEADRAVDDAVGVTNLKPSS